MTPPEDGHDGPYDAPIRIAPRAVPAEWIDYNGHMNVAYYTMAFDQSLDVFLERELGIGERFVASERLGPYALQAHLGYLGELLEGQSFTIEIQLVDADAKRMHVMLVMRNSETGEIAATCEEMLMNVDLKTRKSAPYTDWAQTRIQRLLRDHADLERPVQMGQAIGIRRKG